MKSTEGSYVRPDRAPAILCDFDDTVAVQNVAEVLLGRFGDGRVEQARRMYGDGLISFKEYQERAFGGIEAGLGEMVSYVRAQVTLRTGFREMWHYCQASDIPLAVVTLGLDFYVNALLDREGLSDIPFYAVGTDFTPQGIEYHYPRAQDGCRSWGNCKCSVLESYRGRGHPIVYVGDGRSDYCPAPKADVVFARSHLAERCRETGIPFRDFADFRDVLAYLKGLASQERGGG